MKKEIKNRSFRHVSDYDEAFKCQEMVVGSFAKMLSASKDDNWLLPVMQVRNESKKPSRCETLLQV